MPPALARRRSPDAPKKYPPPASRPSATRTHTTTFVAPPPESRGGSNTGSSMSGRSMIDSSSVRRARRGRGRIHRPGTLCGRLLRRVGVDHFRAGRVGDEEAAVGGLEDEAGLL